jgi:hypothetical protein
MRLKSLLVFVAVMFLGCVSAFAASQPGRFLIPYPDADDADYAKTHPTPSVSDVRPKLALEASSQQVADEILVAENNRQCLTGDARYFQIKAVYELEQNELDLADRDLRRAHNATVLGCQAVQVAELTLPPVAMTSARGRSHRHVLRHHKHCKCA